MKPGRNDPCPCGSGRKYKRCCEQEDARSASTRQIFGRERAHRAPAEGNVDGTDAHWEAELVPLPGGIETEPTARLTAVLIVSAEGFIIDSEMIAHPPAESADIGRRLASSIETAVQRAGFAPASVRVRHESVAAALRAELEPRAIDVECVPGLPQLEEASASLREHMSGMEGPMPAVSMPHTWAAWELPDDLLAEVFAAAAAFHRASPWKSFGIAEGLSITLPGAAWFAEVLGEFGEQHGIALYENLDDMAAVIEGPGPEAPFSGVRSAMLSLTFDTLAELPPPMRREFRRARWEIAGPGAHPVLWTLNTPGGGLTRAQAMELAASLRAVAHFATLARNAQSRGEEPPQEWVDERTGVAVRYLGILAPLLDSPWELPDRLEPSLAEGRGADPRRVPGPDDDLEAFTGREREVLGGFEAWLRRDDAPDARLRRDVANAGLLIDGLVNYQAIGLAAITELDLRMFLYDLYPRKFMSSMSAASSLRGSLRRFFRFLAEEEAIVCQWARPMLSDRATFEERCRSVPGGGWWDPDVRAWRQALFDDLDDRVLLPGPMLGGDDQRPFMGEVEARERRTLEREWLIWRDALIRAGRNDREQLRAALVARQRAWEQEPRREQHGRSVRDMVGKERTEQGQLDFPF